MFVGAVGYVYDQLTGDSGSGDRVGPFESRVFGIGPQLGYLFPVGEHTQGYLNLKGYKEFDAEHRPDGWNVWLTFAFSPAAPVRRRRQRGGRLSRSNWKSSICRVPRRRRWFRFRHGRKLQCGYLVIREFAFRSYNGDGEYDVKSALQAYDLPIKIIVKCGISSSETPIMA